MVPGPTPEPAESRGHRLGIAAGRSRGTRPANTRRSANGATYGSAKDAAYASAGASNNIRSPFRRGSGDADRKREAGDGFREWPDLKRTVIQEQDDRDDDEDVEQRGTEVLRGHLRVRDGSRAPDHFPDRPNQGRRGRSSEEQNGTVDDRERWGFQRQLHRVTEESECWTFAPAPVGCGRI